MTKILLPLVLMISFFAHAGEALPVSNGDYEIKVTQSVKHPKIDFPDSPIPAEQYSPVKKESKISVRLSDDGNNVELPNIKASGKLTKATPEKRIYHLDKGLFAGGQITIEKTKTGLIASYTVFGFGVPVIHSERGKLTVTAKKGNPGKKESE